MMTRDTQVAVAREESAIDADPELLRLSPVWNGILHEFRNHLTVLLAAAGEIRAVAPVAGTAEVSAALAQTEWNVERLNGLVEFVDAAIRDGSTVIADLDDVVERALRLAAPALGRTSVSLHKERRTGITNRGSVLESMLAALLMELAQSERKGPGPGAERRTQIEIHVEATRGTLYLAIESDGGRPPTDSWRFALAADLAARLGAQVTTLPETAGYLVRFT